MQAAGLPRFRSIVNAQHIQYAKYGLITNGPLKGTAFGPAARRTSSSTAPIASATSVSAATATAVSAQAPTWP
jgi:hypothetical protein